MKRLHFLILDFVIILSALIAIILTSCRSTKVATATEETSLAVKKSEGRTSIFDQVQMFSSLSFDSLIISMKPGIKRQYLDKGSLPDSMVQLLHCRKVQGVTVDSEGTDSLNVYICPESFISSMSCQDHIEKADLPNAEIKLYGLHRSATQTETMAADGQQEDSTALYDIRYVATEEKPKVNVFLCGAIIGVIGSAIIALLLWLLMRRSRKS